jgi:23S rRNA (guanosine2251-2'-O)-methyltransferase
MKIEGKNAVFEAINSENVTVDSILALKGEGGKIVAAARAAGVKVQFVDKAVLDKASETGHHQGYIATATDFVYSDVDDILDGVDSPLIVILEEINDPHNFGSIIRVCECAGVDGIIIAKNRQVAVNETVCRVSAGAVSHVKIARVTNINRTIEQLQSRGLWIYCADMDGQSMYTANLTGGIGIVIGGEGAGVSRLTREKCDGIVSIDMFGKVNSLNASVACALVVYEAVRQRKKK